MKRQKPPSDAARFALLPAAALACALLLASPASADIYRWEDEGGVIHFTDDPSAIPPDYRGKATEILKAPPPPGRPSLSTTGDSSPPPGPGASSSSPSPDGEPLGTAFPPDDDTTRVEKLRAKIDAKERFLREVDGKQSLATNPYRNRLVSPSDLELYGKYKEELPGDRERLKELEALLPPQ